MTTGWYHIYPYILGKINLELVAEHITWNPEEGLALLEINLSNYASTSISRTALSQLDKLLALWTTSGKKVILRFLYDWDGTAERTEPCFLRIILHHIKQCARVVNVHTSSIFVMQGLFVGDYGELHGGKFCTDSALKRLYKCISTSFDPAIPIAVRTPNQWRLLTGRLLPSSQERLGLFNDGLLGSSTDLGTFLPDEREYYIHFARQLSACVPFGGEVVFSLEPQSVSEQIAYLKSLGVCYLNAAYHPDVLHRFCDTPHPDGGSYYDDLTTSLSKYFLVDIKDSL